MQSAIDTFRIRSEKNQKWIRNARKKFWATQNSIRSSNLQEKIIGLPDLYFSLSFCVTSPIQFFTSVQAIWTRFEVPKCIFCSRKKFWATQNSIRPSNLQEKIIGRPDLYFSLSFCVTLIWTRNCQIWSYFSSKNEPNPWARLCLLLCWWQFWPPLPRSRRPCHKQS